MARRKEIDAFYRQRLKEVNGISVVESSGQEVANYSYFPILIEPEYPLSRDELYQKLKDENIFARRYFYPLISEFPMYRGMTSAKRDNLPVANATANKVICLPIYPALTNEDLSRIIEVIKAI